METAAIRDVSIQATHVYVSGYGPEITHFALDREQGALEPQSKVSAGTAPSYLAVANDRRALYAVDEAGGNASQIIAFVIDSETGALSEINRAPSGGYGAPHLAVHPSDALIAVAHYSSGHTSLLPVRADRGVERPTQVTRGPNDACRKAHQAVFDASGRHLLVPALENDYVLQFVVRGGELHPNEPASVHVDGGPRHITLSPDERHAYVLSELDSLITSFEYDAARGTLSGPQTIDSEESVKGASAHGAVHPSGRSLYASNRAENSLGLFSIDVHGRPHPEAFERDGIDTPRDFAIDPLGEFLILSNQDGPQDLRLYRIDPGNHRLHHLQSVVVGGHPTCVSFAVLP